MKTLKIRRMLLSDLREVMEIDRLSLSVPWTEGIWRSELESPLGLHLVAEADGRICAQIGAKRVLDELHITTLAVHPDSRRSGVARSLLEAVVEESPDVKVVHLEVRTTNEDALAFYQAFGFEKIGTRPRYYGDEDAVLMTLSLRGR